MTISDQIRDEKLQCDINRETAKISALPSGKIHKYEYLTGKDILPSNQQQVIQQAKFTYSPLGKAFEKQIKPKEETKPIEDKPNNQSRAAIIFNELIKKRKDLMKELHDSYDYNNLKFEYVGPTKDVSFYEYKDSRELFHGIKDNQINFDDVDFGNFDDVLNKLSNIKIGKKTPEQRETIDNFEKFYHSREEIINFFKLMQPTNKNKMKPKENDVKY